MAYRYETHLHTAPVSRCGRASVEETVKYYKAAGYDGIFITNHFIGGNFSMDETHPYEERVRFYFGAVDEGKKLGKKYGLKVFSGAELNWQGAEFLTFGLDTQWYIGHPELTKMPAREGLKLLKDCGAMIIQAHPFREAPYLDHINLYPRNVEGIEVYNAANSEQANHMAEFYAKEYGLIPSAGSDNHAAGNASRFGGVESDEPVSSEKEFIKAFRAGKFRLFRTEK